MAKLDFITESNNFTIRKRKNTFHSTSGLSETALKEP